MGHLTNMKKDMIVKNGQHWAISTNALNELINKQASNNQPNHQAILGIESNLEHWLAGNYKYITTADGIAIIEIKGVLYRYDNWETYFGEAMSYEGISNVIMKAMYDPKVKGILLHVNSCGGEVDGLFEISEMIKSCDKPTLSYVTGMALSAGYGIASSADRIVSQQSATTGSVGVISTYYDDSKFMERVGIEAFTFVSSISPNKNPDPAKPEGGAKIQEFTDKLGEMFLNLVATNRGKTYEYAKANFGQGGIALAEDALSMGLIDQVGSLPVAIESLKSLLPKGEYEMAIGIEANGNHRTSSTRAEEGKPSEEEDKTKKTDMSEGDPGEENKEEKAEVTEPDKKEDEKAEDDMDEEEEIEKDKEVAKFAKERPGLFARIKLAGKHNERKRQEAIEDVIAGYPGHKKLIAQLRFDTSMSAAEISFECMKAQKAGLADKHIGRLTDAKEVPVISGMNSQTSKPEAKDIYAQNMASQLQKNKTRR